MTDSLVAFLRARADEDEQAARAANGPEWQPGDGNVSEGGLYAEEWAIAWFEMGWTNPPSEKGHLPAFPNVERHAQGNAEHAARHDPARVLAEVHAKRQITNLQSSALFTDYDGGYQVAVEDVLKFLALPYADHADYREEWRP